MAEGSGKQCRGQLLMSDAPRSGSFHPFEQESISTQLRRSSAECGSWLQTPRYSLLPKASWVLNICRQTWWKLRANSMPLSATHGHMCSVFASTFISYNFIWLTPTGTPESDVAERRRRFWMPVTPVCFSHRMRRDVMAANYIRDRCPI